MARHSMLLTCSHLRIGEYSPLVDSALPENRQMAAEYMLTITDCWRTARGRRSWWPSSYSSQINISIVPMGMFMYS